MSSEEELTRIYQALGNPHRRRILYLLGSRGPMSFSELKRCLNLSIGALYYNLDQLGDLVTQLRGKKYALTSKGMAVYSLMKNEEDLFEEATSKISLPSWTWSLFNSIRQLFFPRELLSILYAQQPPRLLAIATAVVALGVVACALTGTDVFLTYVRTGFRGTLTIPELGIYVKTDPRLFSALTFIATWLVFSIFPYAVVSVLKWEWGWRRLGAFLEGSAVSMLPAVAYVVINSAAMNAGLSGYAVYMALGVLFAVLWAVMIGSIAASLSIVKRISGSRALIIMVVVAYLCMASQQGLIVKWILQR